MAKNKTEIKVTAVYDGELDASDVFIDLIARKYRKNSNEYEHFPKNLKSQYGEFQIDVPRDRNGEFEPKLIPKYQRNISGIE